MDNFKKIVLSIIFSSIITFSNTAYSISVPTNVSVNWLKTNINQKDLVIVEMSDLTDYEFNGHIPGSVFTNKSNWRYEDTDGSLIHLSAKRLQQLIRELGINNSSAVVIYYKGTEINEILGAYYLLWLFHLMGHTNVGMLDQGWSGWLKNNGQVADDIPEITEGQFTAHPLPALEISTQELNTIRKHFILVDGRPKTHFNGTDKFSANPKYGRIPGSISQPWSDYINKDSDKRLYVKTPDLAPIFKHNKIDSKQMLLLTCLGGTGAAFNYVIFYIGGHHNMRLDDAGLRRWNTLELPLIKTKKSPLNSKQVKSD
ncbi:MAG: sulfurtransferase [Gammaproteobacteria bacterium]